MGIPTTKIRSAARMPDYGPMHNSVSSDKPLVVVGRQKCSYTDQIKSFPDSRYALSLPRRELKILVGLLTGNNT